MPSDPLGAFISAPPKAPGKPAPASPAPDAGPLGAFIAHTSAPAPKTPVAPPAPKEEGFSGFVHGIEKNVEGLFTPKAPPKAAPPIPGKDPIGQWMPKSAEAAPTKPDVLAAHMQEPAARAARDSAFAFGMPSETVADSTSPTPTQADTGTIIKDVAQAFPRDVAAVGSSIGQALFNTFGTPKQKNDAYDVASGLSPDTTTDWYAPASLKRFLFGDTPVQNLSADAAKNEADIKQSGFAKQNGFDKYATAFGVLGATSPIGLDFFGLGGEKSVIDALAAARDVETAARILRQIGVHEDLVLPAAEHMAGTGDAAEIRGALKSVEAIQKSTHYTPARAVAGAAEEETTKGAEAVIRGAGDAVASEVEGAGKTALTATRKTSARAAGPLPARAAATLPTRSIETITKALDEAAQHASFLDDVVSDHPGRGLMKFRSRETGMLPEVRGTRDFTGKDIKGKRGVFATRGDDIVQDMLGQTASGGGDVDIAQQRLDEYVKVRDQRLEVQAELKALRQELKNAKWYARDEGKKAAVLARAAKPREVPEKNFHTREEKQQGTVGDFLRRGAEVLRGGKSDIPETVVQGNASSNAQRTAILESMHGGIEQGAFKGFSPAMRDWFQDWIFQRQSVEIDTKVALKRIEVLKNQDPEHFNAWLHNFLGKALKTDARDGRTYLETGQRVRSGTFGMVEDMLDKWLSEEQAAGIKVADKSNYLPIYLKNAADRSEEMLADRRVGLRPGFSLRSEFKDYVEAKAAGYEPAYTNVYDILQARARAHLKAMADATFFRTGARNGWIVPESALDPTLRGEFSHLDSERMPTQQAAYGNTVYRGVFTAPNLLAKKINNFLSNADPTLQAIANVAGSLKSTALSIGIPDVSKLPGVKQVAERSPGVVKDLLNAGSGLVVHFWNVLPREVAADFAIAPARAPFEIAKYLYYGLNPRAAARYIEKNLGAAQMLSRNGMKLATEDQAFHALGDLPTSITSKAGAGGKAVADYMHSLFGQNFFQKVMPARKIENGIRLMKSYQKFGYTETEAARAAANNMNVVYGGINWESLGRSRNFQAMLRGAFLAPDYAETNIRQGARFIKGFVKPTSIAGRLYRGMMYTYVSSYLMANLLNHENSGHWMYQNDLLHQFSIDMGKDPENGKTRYLNIYGTGVEWARIPVYTITALAQGNLDALHTILLNRLSVPYATVASLVLNVDWKGDKIFGPTRFGQPQTGGQEAQNAFDNTLGRVLPGSVSEVRSIAGGKESLSVGVPKAFGMPVTEKNTSASPEDVASLKLKAAANVKKGDYRLLNELIRAGVIPARSRARFVRQALYGPTKKQQASKAKTKKKNAQVRQDATPFLGL